MKKILKGCLLVVAGIFLILLAVVGYIFYKIGSSESTPSQTYSQDYPPDYDFKVDGISYDIISESEVSVHSVYDYDDLYKEQFIIIPKTVTYNGTTYRVTAIGEGAFNGVYGSMYRNEDYNWSVKSVTIPNSITSIGAYAFYGCSGLTSITIPNSVTTIGDNAFERCVGLTSITIGSSVTSIDENDFVDCSFLKAIDVAKGNKYYSSKDGVLYSKDMTKLIFCPRCYTGALNIPNSITTIEDGTFSNRTNLTSVIIPNSVTSIGKGAFSRCDSLTSVTIPNSVTTIRNATFEGCKSLISITIPNSVTTIGEDAFSHCESLKSITIPNFVTEIGSGAFSDCSSLKAIDVAEENKYYSSKDGILYSKDMTKLICCPMGYTGALDIPNSITTIEDGTFSNRTNLTSVTIPNSVTSIGRNAFYQCSSLTSVTIPKSVTSIGDRAFLGCESLTSVTIPNSVTTIRNATFEGCRSLTSVTIPNSVTTIGENAFDVCDKLEKIYISCPADAKESAITKKFKKLLPKNLRGKIKVVKQ